MPLLDGFDDQAVVVGELLTRHDTAAIQGIRMTTHCHEDTLAVKRLAGLTQCLRLVVCIEYSVGMLR